MKGTMPSIPRRQATVIRRRYVGTSLSAKWKGQPSISNQGGTASIQPVLDRYVKGGFSIPSLGKVSESEVPIRTIRREA
jgi:hypothetical protein